MTNGKTAIVVLGVWGLVGASMWALSRAPELTPEVPTRKETVTILSQNDVTNIINVAVTNGMFCSVRGHVWQPYVPATLLYVPNRYDSRKCGICGLTQERIISDWR